MRLSEIFSDVIWFVRVDSTQVAKLFLDVSQCFQHDASEETPALAEDSRA